MRFAFKIKGIYKFVKYKLIMIRNFLKSTYTVCLNIYTAHVTFQEIPRESFKQTVVGGKFPPGSVRSPLPECWPSSYMKIFSTNETDKTFPQQNVHSH